MKLIKKEVPCKKCDGLGEVMFDGIAINCEECSGKGEVIKTEYVVVASQRARDSTRKWMKKIVQKNK